MPFSCEERISPLQESLLCGTELLFVISTHKRGKKTLICFNILHVFYFKQVNNIQWHWRLYNFSTWVLKTVANGGYLRPQFTEIHLQAKMQRAKWEAGQILCQNWADPAMFRSRNTNITKNKRRMVKVLTCCGCFLCFCLVENQQEGTHPWKTDGYHPLCGKVGCSGSWQSLLMENSLDLVRAPYMRKNTDENQNLQYSDNVWTATSNSANKSSFSGRSH